VRTVHRRVFPPAFLEGQRLIVEVARGLAAETRGNRRRWCPRPECRDGACKPLRAPPMVSGDWPGVWAEAGKAWMQSASPPRDRSSYPHAASHDAAPASHGCAEEGANVMGLDLFQT
jgi:hypothetical protein